MKIKFHATKYFGKNKQVLRVQAVSFMILGLLILGIMTYGVFIMWSNINTTFEDWNSDSSYDYESAYQQVYDDCIKECRKDYGDLHGNYKDAPLKKIIVTVTSLPGDRYNCECLDSTGYGGWDAEYG